MPSFTAFLASKSQSSTRSPLKGEIYVTSTKNTSQRKFSIVSKIRNSNFRKNASKLLKYTSPKNGIHKSQSTHPPPPSFQSSPEDLTLFLQYKTNIKKFFLDGGYSNLTIARLQLAFIEKFAQNTYHNSMSLPKIYIEDPVSGVHYELEDLRDVKDRSLLVMNDEAFNNTKSQEDEGLCVIKRLIKELKATINEQQEVLQKVTNCQQDITKELSEIETTMSSIYRKFNYRAAESYTPPEPSSINTSASGKNNDLGRKYVEDKKNKINKEFDKLVGNVDNLLKAVEELRVDGTVCGLEPLPRKLQTVSKDLALADVKLKKMKEVVNDEQLIWNNTWDNEIERVRDDREYVRMYEGLGDELQDDITKAYHILTLVKSIPKLQKKKPSKSSSRAITRG